MIHLINGVLSDDIYNFVVAQLQDKADGFLAMSTHLEVDTSGSYFIDVNNGRIYVVETNVHIYDEEMGDILYEKGSTVFAEDVSDLVERGLTTLNRFTFFEI